MASLSFPLASGLPPCFAILSCSGRRSCVGRACSCCRSIVSVRGARSPVWSLVCFCTGILRARRLCRCDVGSLACSLSPLPPPPPPFRLSLFLSPAVLHLARVLSLRFGLAASLVCNFFTPLALAVPFPSVGLTCLCLAVHIFPDSVLRGSLVLSLGCLGPCGAFARFVARSSRR